MTSNHVTNGTITVFVPLTNKKFKANKANF